ncbi:bifunctional th2 protein, partial [Quercus suber]
LTSPFSLSFLESLGDRSEAIAAIADTTSSSMVGGVGVGVGVGVGPVVAVVDEGGLGKRFWIKVRNDTAAVLYSPFFVSLASGHLLPETFRHCISQDVHFLRAYAQAYEMAENCADDDEDKRAIRSLRKRVLEKLKAHPTLVQEWGFELPDESIPISATVKYTDFLLAAASGRIEGEKFLNLLKLQLLCERTKMCCLYSCCFGTLHELYAYISSEIQALLKPVDSNHLYKKWIDSYSSQNFEASALQIEEMLDKLSISLTGEELEVIEKLYHQAMKLEVDFFSTLPISQKTVVPLARVHDPAEHHLTIFCDFDLTCTAFDSSAILAEMAIITAPKADSDVSETQLARMSSADLRNSWGALSAQYTEEFEQCVDSMMDSERAESFDYEGLHKALEQVAEFEKEQIHGSAFSSGDLDELKVHSNELTYEESVTTGGIDKKVESPMEKLQGFNEILNNCNSKGKQLTVYIGGAVGDLLCLLQADVGIVLVQVQA